MFRAASLQQGEQKNILREWLSSCLTMVVISSGNWPKAYPMCELCDLQHLHADVCFSSVGLFRTGYGQEFTAGTWLANAGAESYFCCPPWTIAICVVPLLKPTVSHRQADESSEGGSHAFGFGVCRSDPWVRWQGANSLPLSSWSMGHLPVGKCVGVQTAAGSVH